MADKKKYITELYSILLGRVPLDVDYDFYLTAIEYAGPEGISTMIASSQEGRNYLINEWFLQYLARSPIQSDLDYFWAIFQIPSTEEQVLASILSSIEFYNHAQGIVTAYSPDENFIRAIFVLSNMNNFTQNDINKYISLIASSRLIAVQTLLTDYLFRFNFISQLYSNWLNKDPIINEVINWASSSELNFYLIKIRFLTSPDFYGGPYSTLRYKNIGILLPGPDFDNSNKLVFTKINRKTRGGDLIIFRDNMWSKDESFSVQWSGLSGTDAKKVVDLGYFALGQVIKYTDYLGRVFNAIISIPVEMSQNNRETFSVKMELILV